MPALTKSCFEKGCKCANCRYLCSRCMVRNIECFYGKHKCTEYSKLPFNDFVDIYKESGISLITREIYDKIK